MTAVHVAVGIICRGDRILVARRRAGSHQGGLWEFPGGKVEPEETVTQALARELEEELGIQTGAAEALLEVSHDYGDKVVLLDVWWIDQFRGQTRGREGQTLRWAGAEQLTQLNFPAANKPIVSAVLARLRSR